MNNEHSESPQRGTIKSASNEDAQRRLRLRVAAKLMGYLAFAGVAYVFISAIMSGDGEVRSVPSLRVDISQLQPGQVQFLTWEGRPVLVYRRSNADIVQLRTVDERLADPDSGSSEQPEFAINDWRSQNPDYFVAIALGTGQGCTVEFMPPDNETFQGTAWQGGFRDSCGKDRYDLAGRVYDNQYAGENLNVPQYAIDGNTLVLGR
jgi:ubiquinol-cytochrome c reductase iron-sulfur subunit